MTLETLAQMQQKMDAGDQLQRILDPKGYAARKAEEVQRQADFAAAFSSHPAEENEVREGAI